MDIPEELENFKNAFSTRTSGFVRTCECGMTYYDADYSAYDIEDENEIKQLESDQNAIAIHCSVGTVVFENKEYVCQCDCWHERALKIAAFIDSHSYGIADFINLQKKTALAEAEAMPEVKE